MPRLIPRHVFPKNTVRRKLVTRIVDGKKMLSRNNHKDLVNEYLSSPDCKTWFMSMSPDYRWRRLMRTQRASAVFTSLMSYAKMPQRLWVSKGLDYFVSRQVKTMNIRSIYSDYLLALVPFFKWLSDNGHIRETHKDLKKAFKVYQLETLKPQEPFSFKEEVMDKVDYWMEKTPSNTNFWFMCWLISRGFSEKDCFAVRKLAERHTDHSVSVTVRLSCRHMSIKRTDLKTFEQNFYLCTGYQLEEVIPAALQAVNLFIPNKGRALSVRAVQEWLSEARMWVMLDELERARDRELPVYGLLFAKQLKGAHLRTTFEEHYPIKELACEAMKDRVKVIRGRKSKAGKERLIIKRSSATMKKYL